MRWLAGPRIDSSRTRLARRGCAVQGACTAQQRARSAAQADVRVLCQWSPCPGPASPCPAQVPSATVCDPPLLGTRVLPLVSPQYRMCGVCQCIRMARPRHPPGSSTTVTPGGHMFRGRHASCGLLGLVTSHHCAGGGTFYNLASENLRRAA